MRRSPVAEGLLVTRTEQLGTTSPISNFTLVSTINRSGSSSYPSRMKLLCVAPLLKSSTPGKGEIASSILHSNIGRSSDLGGRHFLSN